MSTRRLSDHKTYSQLRSGSTYSGLIASHSPLVYWRLAETSGTTIADSSGNGRNGTLSGSGYTLGSNSLLTPADNDHAIAMTGASGITLANDAGLDSLTTYSIALLFNTSSLSNAVMQLVNKNATVSGWEMRIENTSGPLRFFANQTTNYTAVKNSSALIAGKTYHAVGTWDGANAHLYVNGVSDTTLIVSGSGAASISTDPIVLGQRTGETSYTGVIDEFAYFPTALSSTDVAALAHAAGF